MLAVAFTSCQPTGHVLRLFKEAADLKVMGHSWAVVAGKLARSERTLRHWRERYPEAWAKQMVEAYEDTLQRVGGAALVGLSHIVTTKDHPHHWRGCQFLYGRLFQLMLNAMKLQSRTPAAPAIGPFW